MTHSRFLRGLHGPSTADLALQTKAVRYLSCEMRDQRRAILDPHIYAVLVLGYSRSAPLRIGPHPRQSPLRELQSIHVYCTMELILEHIAGLMRLIQVRGGAELIETPRIGQTVSL